MPTIETAKPRLLVAAALLAVLPSVPALAQTQPADSTKSDTSKQPASDIAEGSDIVVTGTRANEIAPVTASLETTQPQAIVSRSFIQDSLPTAADFNQLALITPSVSNACATNGVGLSESNARLRGFQDGEYNITYDGVPFGDQNDPTHHSNTFFPSNTIETLIVDRGPGNASQLGQATFGGSINLFSRAARDKASAELLGSYGSFNTYLAQAVLQSGSIDALGGTRIVASGQYVNSRGALSYERYKQLNGYVKAVIPIGASARLSLLATANRNDFHQPDNPGATLTQVGLYGKDFALNNDPTTPQYFGYNTTKKTTDFYIARFEADIAPNSVFENSAYSYHYKNQTLTALDVTGGTANMVTLADGKTKVAGIPGYTKTNDYRVYGDIAKVKLDFGFGAVTVGGLIEWSNTYRQQTDYNLVDMSFDYREKAVTAPSTGLNPGAATPRYIRYNQNSSLNHTELFGELELRPFQGLKITPGIKYVDFNRKIDATVNQTTRYAQSLSKTYTATLPFLTANYQVTDNLAVYAQYARGFLTPPLSQLYVDRPGLSTVDPQRSTNYQLGVVYHGSRLSIDADIYSIDFTNKFSKSTSPIPGEGVIFTNLGGALYKGAEGQVTYAFPGGIAVFANASYNYAKVKAQPRTQIANAPFMTAAAGILYKQGPIRFSLIDKLTGAQYAVEGEPAAYRIAPYHNVILSASYDFGIIRAGVKVSDLLDSTKITGITTGSSPAFDQYFFQPGRQITGELTLRF